MLQFLFAFVGAKARRYGKRFFSSPPIPPKRGKEQNCVVARVNGKTDGIIRPDRRREERDPETVAVGRRKNRPCNRISAAAEKIYFVWKTYFLTLAFPSGAKRCFRPLDNWSRQRRQRALLESSRGKREPEKKFSRKKNFSPVLFFLCFLLTRPPPRLRPPLLPSFWKSPPPSLGLPEINKV